MAKTTDSVLAAYFLESQEKNADIIRSVWARRRKKINNWSGCNGQWMFVYYFSSAASRIPERYFCFCSFCFWNLTHKQKVIAAARRLLGSADSKMIPAHFLFVCVCFPAPFCLFSMDSSRRVYFYAFDLCSFFLFRHQQQFIYYYFAYGCHSLCILWIDQTIIIFKLLFDFGKCCFCFRLSAMMTLNQSNKRFPIAVICCGLQSDDFVAAAKNENKKKQMKRVNTNWILILISQDYAQHTHAVLLCIKLNKNIYEVFQRHHYTHGLCVYHLDGPVNDNKQREKAWWKPFKTNKMVYGFDVLLKFVTLNQFMDFI